MAAFQTIADVAAAPAAGNRRILIVDDNRAIHDDFRKILGQPPLQSSALAELEQALFGQAPARPRPEPFAIDSAYQGQEGQALVREARAAGRPYAVAFVDVRMPPGWDGVETAAQIWDADPEVQIVICTAYSDYSWEDTIDKLGAESERFLILKKPFDHVEVRQLATALTKKWDLGRQARAKLDELEEIVRSRTSAIREAHERLQRELAQRHRVEAQLRRAQKLEALGRLAAGIAHEINNPLAFVIANMQFVRESLETGAADAEVRTALAEACVGGERIKQIVRDLKAFAQPHDESLAVVDVRPVVDFSIKMAAAEIRRRAQLTTQFDEVPAVWAISGRLEQVFVNLLINAAHAIPPGRPQDNQIRVAVRAQGDSVLVEVSDTGVGIPQINLERIFDPFFTTKPVGVGTGLGLSICHSIVTAFGGELTVESEEGKGSRFRVGLPSAGRSAEAQDPRAPALRLPDVARILLVDAEPAIAKAMRRVLSSHKVETADSGLEALAMVRERRFDLVLYDIAVPDLPPVDMYRRLQELGGGAERRLVFTSAGALPPEVAAFINDAAAACLDKPFDAAEVDLLLQTRGG
jgi:two-component system, NtrC family, sensor kinase